MNKPTKKKRRVVHFAITIRSSYALFSTIALFSTLCGANYQTVHTSWDHKKVRVTCKNCLRAMKARK